MLLGCTLETTDAVSHGQTVPHSMDWATALAHLPVPVPANLDFTLGTVLARTTNYLSSRRLLSSSVWSIFWEESAGPGLGSILTLTRPSPRVDATLLSVLPCHLMTMATSTSTSRTASAERLTGCHHPDIAHNDPCFLRLCPDLRCSSSGLCACLSLSDLVPRTRATLCPF